VPSLKTLTELVTMLLFGLTILYSGGILYCPVVDMTTCLIACLLAAYLPHLLAVSLTICSYFLFQNKKTAPFAVKTVNSVDI